MLSSDSRNPEDPRGGRGRPFQNESPTPAVHPLARSKVNLGFVRQVRSPVVPANPPVVARSHKRTAVVQHCRFLHHQGFHPKAVVQMCDSLDNEIHRMASSFHDEHGRDVSGIATLVHVSECLFGHYESQHDLSLSALLGLQRECISLWLGDRGIDWQEVEVALVGLDRANQTAGYLAALPA